ncbi:MAG: transposase [Desulfobacterales bacterium]
MREFKDSLPCKASEIIYKNNIKVRFFSYGETGFGLMTSPGKRITLSGVRPVGLIQRTFENYYIYGAGDVADGENFFPEFSNMNTDCLQCFIDEFSKHFQNIMNIMLIDSAGIHKAERLVIPENIRLIFLPPYSPDLNPIERFWQYIKKDTKGKIFFGIPEMKDCAADILKKCSSKTTASLTGFSYILDAINGLLQ